jgi:glycosyltransferase involved in cell wall biosynthesis
MDQHGTIIIIPAYNEADGLPDVLEGLRAAAPQHAVLVVDDGSSDETAEVARQPGVNVLQLPFNLGIGGALRTGFRYAIQHGYLRAVQFDADGQHDPTEIAPLLEALDSGADMVVGSRFATGPSAYGVGRFRRGAMRATALAVRMLSGRTFTDTSSGFRAFSRPMLEYFARTYPVEYMDSVEALILACYSGFKVMEVPARMHERVAGQPSNRNVRLVYHYLRLMVVLLTTASRRGRRLPEAVS